MAENHVFLPTSARNMNKQISVHLTVITSDPVFHIFLTLSSLLDDLGEENVSLSERKGKLCTLKDLVYQL